VPDGKGFMGRSRDAFVPPPAVWDECLRVLKPGGHLLAFAGSRTADLMGLSVRMAGLAIRDTIMWVCGSGCPQWLDVSKPMAGTRARRHLPCRARRRARHQPHPSRRARGHERQGRLVAVPARTPVPRAALGAVGAPA